jgi:hypothetical protein
MDEMSALCCVKDCEEPAAIKQPLKLGGELVVHVPLCEAHGTAWEDFADRLRKARERSAREHRQNDWLFDSALALALFPPGEPL